MAKRDKVREIIALTWARLGGSLSRAEHERLIGQILTNEPELPLGIGAPTEAVPGRPAA